MFNKLSKIQVKEKKSKNKGEKINKKKTCTKSEYENLECFLNDD